MGQNKRVFRIVKDEIKVSSFRPSHMKDGIFFFILEKSWRTTSTLSTKGRLGPLEMEVCGKDHRRTCIHLNVPFKDTKHFHIPVDLWKWFHRKTLHLAILRFSEWLKVRAFIKELIRTEIMSKFNSHHMWVD